MAEEILLAAVRRADAGREDDAAKGSAKLFRTPRQLRRGGFIPAVLYGHGVAPISLAVEARAFVPLLPRLSSSTLITLRVGDDARRVLVQEVQHDPLTGNPAHIDFHQVKLTEKIRARVPLRGVNVSPAVKDHGGVLVQSMAEVEVEALPNDLPAELTFDLTHLKTFEDRLTVGDLVLPSGVTVHAHTEDAIAVVIKPRSEEEVAAAAAPSADQIASIMTEAEEKKAAEATAEKEQATGK